MKLTVHEARHVFGLRADVDKHELRRLFSLGQKKLMHAYFALLDHAEESTQAEGFDGPEFAKTFIQVMQAPGGKKTAMETFVAACQDFLTNRGIELDEPYWGSDGPVTDKQHEVMAKKLNELPNTVPTGLMNAFRVFQEDMNATTRVTASALFDAISTMKRTKVWPK